VKDDTDTSISFNRITPNVIVANYKSFYNLNAAAVALNNFIIVIDPLYYPSQGKRFRKHIESEFELPVKYLFITHYHGDHVFGMSAFNDVDVIGTDCLASNMLKKIETQWTQKALDDWKNEDPSLAAEIDAMVFWPPNITFEDSYTIHDDKLTLELKRSGGHTGCSAFAFLPSEKILFAGDDIAAYDWPYISDETGSPDNYIRTLECMLNLDINKVVPGHGVIVDKKLIKEYLDYILKLKHIVIESITKGLTPEEIEVPEFYHPATEWQIPEAMKFMHKFYSDKMNKE